ncbi:hypothetical protein AHAS_Ahas09G0165500 [Arachis hypogaea]
MIDVSWLDAFSAHRHICDAISRAPIELISELCQFRAKYRRKFAFEFFTTTDMGHLHKILEEVKGGYKILASKGLELQYAYQRRGLSQKKIQKETEDIREVVQDSMEEEVVPNNSSDEIVSTGPKACMINYDINKTPEENERF